MTYVYLVAASIVFVELLIRLDLKGLALRMASRSREALGVISSEETDDVKAASMRRASIDIFGATFGLVVRLAVIGAVLAASFWIVVTLFPELEGPILENALSPAVVVALTLVAAAYGWIRHVAVEQP